MALGETIADKINRLADSKAAIAAALFLKGATIPDGIKVSGLADIIRGISTGVWVDADTCVIDRNSEAEINIPAGTSHIGNFAFRECNATSFNIQYGVISIGNYAFYSCSGIETLALPSGLLTIGDYAFSDCWMLGSLTIPSSVTSIGVNALRGTNLYQVYIDKPKLEVFKMSNFPWGINKGAVFHCADGNLTVA